MIRLPMLASIVALCLTAGGPLSAKPPSGATPNSLWFESLADPETTLSCCDEADCRPVEDRIVSDDYEVLIRGAWLPVPFEKIFVGRTTPRGARCCAGAGRSE